MNVPIRQMKFNGGEITPLLYGDTSHARYGSALRLCKNWLPLPQGALTVRPGTLFKDRTTLDQKGRQISFIFSDEIAYVLLFTDLEVKIYRTGVLQTTLVTPWTTDMLPRLKYAQVGNTITFTVQGMAPRDISYSSTGLTWIIGLTPFAPPSAAVWTSPAGSVGTLHPLVPRWTAGAVVRHR
jgi:hypothetical protein